MSGGDVGPREPCTGRAAARAPAVRHCGVMELRDAIRARRMTRRFDADRPVPEPALAQILDHALRAPSAGMSRGWDFVVLTDPADRTAYWAVTTDDASRPEAVPDAWLRGVSAAPVLILCCSDPDTYLDRYAEPDKGWTDRDSARWPIPYWDVDVGMAAMLMLLTAVDHGLGALFFGVPAGRHAAVRAAFAIPGGHRLVGVVALGYPLADAAGRGRHARRGSWTRGRRADAVHHGRFSRT